MLNKLMRLFNEIVSYLTNKPAANKKEPSGSLSVFPQVVFFFSESALFDVVKEALPSVAASRSAFHDHVIPCIIDSFKSFIVHVADDGADFFVSLHGVFSFSFGVPLCSLHL